MYMFTKIIQTIPKQRTYMYEIAAKHDILLFSCFMCVVVDNREL